MRPDARVSRMLSWLFFLEWNPFALLSKSNTFEPCEYFGMQNWICWSSVQRTTLARADTWKRIKTSVFREYWIFEQRQELSLSALRCSAAQCSAVRLVSLLFASVSPHEMICLCAGRAGGNPRRTKYLSMIWSWLLLPTRTHLPPILGNTYHPPLTNIVVSRCCLISLVDF